MLARNLLIIGLAAAGLAAIWDAIRPPAPDLRQRGRAPLPATAAIGVAVAGDLAPDIAPIVEQINGAFRADWGSEDIRPADRADDLVLARRLSLALAGTVPALEEIRRLESYPADQRLDRRLAELLDDRRSWDYLAERLARSYVGIEKGPFVVYRRRRFVSWLADQLASNRPYDEIVRELVSAEGLWTDSPATNFVTVTLTDGAKLPNTSRLAGRVTRAFLGVRIDCAECHDHPFERWTQRDFAGLAAFFADSRQTFTGIRDAPARAEQPKQGKSAVEIAVAEPAAVPAAVPWQPELLPATGSKRAQLASWLTDPTNVAFSRAIVNRVWGLLCGRALVEPVDNLPAEVPRAVDLLAEDFAAHGFDLRRLIRTIAATEVFQQSSKSSDDSLVTPQHMELWSVFPLTRLRPEQTARSIFQARSLETVDQETSQLLRLVQFIGQNEFVERNGDIGEDELAPQTGTIPQRLLLMNGKAVRETTDGSNFVNASGRIAKLAPDDRTAIEIAYLTILTRRPTPDEADYFARSLAKLGNKDRARRIEDLCWTLVNSMEFGWNH